MTGHALPYDPAMLEDIDRQSFSGYPRPAKGPERDRLQALGLIESASPSIVSSNRRPYWRTTEKGRQEAATNRKEGIT